MSGRDRIRLPYWVYDVDDGAQIVQNDEKRKIGWIGLGKSGHQLASKLVKAGYDVTLYDKDKSKADDLIKFGAKLANSANDLAPQSDYLFLSVGHSRNLVDLMENTEYGIYDDIKDGGIVINHSSRDPEFQHD